MPEDAWARLVRSAVNELRATICDAAAAGWLVMPCEGVALEEAWRELYDAPRPLGALLCLAQWSPDARAVADGGLRHLWIAREVLEGRVDLHRLHAAARSIVSLLYIQSYSVLPNLPTAPAPRGIAMLQGLEEVAGLALRDASAACALAWVNAGRVYARVTSDATDPALATPTVPHRTLPPTRACARSLAGSAAPRPVATPARARLRGLLARLLHPSLASSRAPRDAQTGYPPRERAPQPVPPTPPPPRAHVSRSLAS